MPRCGADSIFGAQPVGCDCHYALCVLPLLASAQSADESAPPPSNLLIPIIGGVVGLLVVAGLTFMTYRHCKKRNGTRDIQPC